MFSRFKDPLKKLLSADDLLRLKESCSKAGAFIGGSLVKKEACVLPLADEVWIRITGGLETYAANVALPLARLAIEQHQSILALDFQHAEEYWHRLWALSFYLDHAKEFRLFDFDLEERSDYLGLTLPESLAAPAHLRKLPHAADVKEHLTTGKGVVGVCASKENQNALWETTKPWVGWPDLLLVYGWNELIAEQRKTLIDLRRQSASKKMVIVQSQFADSKAEEFSGIDVLFHQSADLPAAFLSSLKQISLQNGWDKSFAKLDARLTGLSEIQCLVLHNHSADLVQTNKGDGLPWPPDYRPLRARYT